LSDCEDFMRWNEGAEIYVSERTLGPTLCFEMGCLEVPTFQDRNVRIAKDSPLLPHFALRIVPFREVTIVLLRTDTEARYVRSN